MVASQARCNSVCFDDFVKACVLGLKCEFLGTWSVEDRLASRSNHSIGTICDFILEAATQRVSSWRSGEGEILMSSGRSCLCTFHDVRIVFKSRACDFGFRRVVARVFQSQCELSLGAVSRTAGVVADFVCKSDYVFLRSKWL